MTLEDISKEIIKLAEEDQKMRKKFEKSGFNRDFFDSSLDKRSETFLKQVVSEIGWLTISKVGKDVSFKAWLLLQHVPDTKFQKKCLGLMEQNLEDVDPKNYAYLKDRILTREGKRQIYGTQSLFNPKTGEDLGLCPLEDPKNVNKRREEVGLNPLPNPIPS